MVVRPGGTTGTAPVPTKTFFPAGARGTMIAAAPMISAVARVGTLTVRRPAATRSAIAGVSATVGAVVPIAATFTVGAVVPSTGRPGPVTSTGYVAVTAAGRLVCAV
ncbi:hypothetical protein GCM10022294_00010 [Dietzia aurantiaca]